MRVVVVTTSFPRSAEDPSGHFVRSSARALVEAGHELARCVSDRALEPRVALERGVGFEKARDQVGATGKRAGLRDLDGVGHAQRGGGRLSRTASRISSKPIRSSGVGSIIH